MDNRWFLISLSSLLVLLVISVFSSFPFRILPGRSLDLLPGDGCHDRLLSASYDGVVIDSFINGSFDSCFWSLNFVGSPRLEPAPLCPGCLMFYESVKRPWQCLFGIMQNLTVLENVSGRGVYFRLAFDSFVRAGIGSVSVFDCFSERDFVESAWFEYNGSAVLGHVNSHGLNDSVEDVVLLNPVGMNQSVFYVLALRVLPEYRVNFLVYDDSFSGVLLANFTSESRIVNAPYRIKFSMFGGWVVLDEVGLFA